MIKYSQSAILLLLSGVSEYKSKYIDCIGSDQCYNQSITCPEHEDCIIQCNGDSACSFSTIFCPVYHSTKCSLTCNDFRSCDHLTVRANNASSLDVTSNGYEPLSFAKIYCPQNSINNWCNITYFGHQNGLNMMNIYTPYNYSAINIKCESINTCWSNGNNPTINYGDLMYSKTSIIHSPTGFNPRIDSAETPYDTTTTEAIIQNISSNKFGRSDAIQYPLYIIVLLITLGMLGGILISLLCCLLYFCIRYYCTKMELTARKEYFNSLKRTFSKNRLSPSLQKLSPELKPADVELQLDAMGLEPISEMLPGGNVVVTVQKYANTENKCDESGVFSPTSTGWCSSTSTPRNRHPEGQMTMDLSKCIGIETDGIAPDEFVVCGDTSS